MEYEIIVGWGSLALIVSGLAQSLNRNGLVWLILSFLFGPVALFVLVVFYGRFDRSKDDTSILFEIAWFLTKLAGTNDRDRIR